ncbi:zinc knuckle CX2CX4HX4C containing protein [Tanacetum coccineum]|uniref:Zinc knuckle CX2CX4HX4C containing protein n=1 Tax=Tanacetum coccineum TaxID=301880 RepID=A0ABQ5GKF1_9ASTR
MDNNLDTSSKEDSSSLLKSVKANALASKVLHIEGKILPRRYTTYQEPLKDAGSSKVSNPSVNEKVAGHSLDKPSFSSIVHEKPQKRTVKIKEMRNEVSVDGAAVALSIEAVETVNARFTNTLYGYFIGDRLAFPLVENYVNNTWAKYGLKRIQLHEEFFLFQFNTREGMESVLENGPWLVRRVPLILNEWTSNTILKKDEIKRVPVWVKMHHVPIVAYSEIGLSLISTQIGKPIMLDSYTSNMCLHSWGRSVYARALIEIAADVELVKSLVIAIPLGNKEGHTFPTIDIDDKCPKLPKVVPTDKAADDGFTEVKKKKAKAKQSSKTQLKGIRRNKPPLNSQYHRS